MFLLRHRFIATAVFVLLLVVPLRGVHADELSRAFLLPELFEIMAEEGRATLADEAETLLQGSALQDWQDSVAKIYDPVRLQAAFSQALNRELATQPHVTEDALRFAASALGQRVLRLEVSAREALLNDEIDMMARSDMDEARFADDGTAKAKRLALVRERIAANDLIELNVSLGLNTSFAHYQGMLAEDAIDGLGAEDLLRLVWAQEGIIRADIEDWIESYFLLAFQPLSDAELQSYIDYARTPEADAFNRAMFVAFDTVFNEVSRQVGRLMGRMLRSQEL